MNFKWLRLEKRLDIKYQDARNDCLQNIHMQTYSTVNFKPFYSPKPTCLFFYSLGINTHLLCIFRMYRIYSERSPAGTPNEI